MRSCVASACLLLALAIPIAVPTAAQEAPVPAVAADLAPALARARARRAEALRLTATGDVRGALDLIELGCWNEMVGIRPYEAPLVAWKNNDSEAFPGIAHRQLWGELAANWAVRQRDLPRERVQELMRTARSALERPGTAHPVLLYELAWLYEDVAPADPEYARLLKVGVRDALAAEAGGSDGGKRSHRLGIRAELAEDFSDCLALLDQAADEGIDDPLARLAALRTWQRLRQIGRTPPQLDTPVSQRQGLFGTRIGGGRPPPEIARHESAIAIAQRCNDAELCAGAAWAATAWGDGNPRVDPAWTAGVARTAATAWRKLDRLGEATRAEACALISEPLAGLAEAAIWERRHQAAEAILTQAEDPQTRHRGLTVRGLAAVRLGRDGADDFAAAAAALHELPTLRDSDVREQSERGRCWLAFARLAAAAQPGPGPVHEQAIAAYAEAAQATWKGFSFHIYAESQREVARLVWDDGVNMRREAEGAFNDAAQAYIKAGTAFAGSAESVWRELSERRHAAGDTWGAVGALLDARDAWLAIPGEKAAIRVAAIEVEAGLHAPDEPPAGTPDPKQDLTQGPGAALVSRIIASLATTPANGRRPSFALLARLLGWPDGSHLLDTEPAAAMRARWHLSSSDCRRLAAAQLQDESGFLSAVLPVIGHRPLAPTLAEALRQTEDRRGFGIAAARIFMTIADEDPALASSLVDLAYGLTWADGRRAVVSHMAKILPNDAYASACRRLLSASQGENDGCLKHLINILARDPRQLPAAELRRLLPLATWHEDRNEILWGLALLHDPVLDDEISRLLADSTTPFLTRALALRLAMTHRLAAAAPGIAIILADDDPESDRRFFHDDALVGAQALGMSIDEAFLQRLATDDWGKDPAPEEMALDGPPQRYRIMTACMLRWLRQADTAAWKRIETAITHPWRRYRCHLVRSAGLSRHPHAAEFIFAIADRDVLLAADATGRADQISVYLEALSWLQLDETKRTAAWKRFGKPVPDPQPASSPNFHGFEKPCDGGPAAPLPP